MMDIQKITCLDAQCIQQLLMIWEDSVRATHIFLTEEDIIKLKPLVGEAFALVDQLWCCTNQAGQMVAFMGVHEQKIEMLFVAPAARGCGIGKRLVEYAIANLNARYVDVNEQNSQAVGFYQYVGFEVFDRSALDGQGNPFPLLHMKLQTCI